MKKLALVVLSLVLLCSMVFAQAAPEAASGKVTLRVMNYIDMSEPNSANEIAMIWDKFAAEHPEIEIIREDSFNDPYHDKLSAYLTQGNLPDVMYAWPSGKSGNLHNADAFMNLKSLLERDGLTDKYSVTTMADQAGKTNYIGELPNGLTATSMMFVNKKVLRENGLEMPKTYADLVAMVPVLAAKGIATVTMDCMDGWVMQSCLFSLITGRFGGADWDVKLKNGEWDFEDQWFINALTALDNLYKDGVINRNTLSLAYGSSKGDFANGKTAFYIDGDWSCGGFQTDVTTGLALISPEAQQNDIELINFPAFDGEVIHESNSAVVGTGWAISADIDADKLEAAWTLVKYLEGEYAQSWRLETGASFPSLITIDVAKFCEEKNLDPLVAKRAQWYNDIQVATPVIDGVLEPEVYNVINVVLAEIGLGTTTVEEAAKTVNAAWHAYIGK